MLVRCLYASRATAAITDEAVRPIIDVSRRNNQAAGVTGLLCADDRNYVQILEGGREQVSALFKRIMTDNRHNDVTLLSFAEIDTRYYGQWAMARLDFLADQSGHGAEVFGDGSVRSVHRAGAFNPSVAGGDGQCRIHGRSRRTLSRQASPRQ